MKKSILILLMLSFVLNANAQSKSREVGIKTYNLTNYSILLKKEKKPNRYRRYSASFNMNVKSNLLLTNSVGFSLGFEKRKSLTNNFEFIHGINPGIHINSSFSNALSSITPSIRMGYILGFQYAINKQFTIGVETIPFFQASVSYFNANNVGEPPSISMRANQSAGLFLIYKF